ncbi:MAG: hypothetical protein ACOYXU_01915 [Nitrospirota bacterium]
MSISMMIQRAFHAGFINDERRQKLYIGMSRRGWRTREPLDDQLPMEEPQVLRKAIELLLTEDIIDAEGLVDETRLSKQDIERISGVPNLSRRLAPVVQLRRRHDEPTKSEVRAPGEIVSFPVVSEPKRA